MDPKSKMKGTRDEKDFFLLVGLKFMAQDMEESRDNRRKQKRKAREGKGVAG